jgi:hypothetical protein
MHGLLQEQQQQAQAQAAQQAAQIEALNQQAIAQGVRIVAAEAAGNGIQANGMPYGYKPTALPSFCGNTGEDVEAWLFQVEQSQTLFPIANESQRIRHIALSLKDTAAKWYSAMQMRDPPELTTWAIFVTKLRQQFVHLDQKWVARNSLHNLRQEGTVRDYSVKFRHLYILVPDMSEPDALDKYVRGLKDFAFKVWRRKYQTLEEAIVYAEELDLEVQQKKELKGDSKFTGPVSDKSRRGSSRSNFFPQPRASTWQPRYEPRQVNGRGGSAPMELGVLRMPVRLSEAERLRHMQEDLCFNCHKPGHRTNVCPRKDPGNGVGRG